MKYGLKCPVTSRLAIPGEVELPWNGWTVKFTPGLNNYLTELTLSASGQDPEPYRNSAQVDKAANKVTVQVNRDQVLHSRLLEAVKSLESILGFYLNLKRIHWESSSVFVEPETTEEASLVDIRQWEVIYTVGDPELTANREQLINIVALAGSCLPLATTLSFFREGATDSKTFRYISAFFNFYFVLEGLFGNGKTKNRDVEAEFKRSNELREAIALVVSRGFEPTYGEDVSVEDRLKGMNKPFDADGIIHMLVWMRGDLHHYVGDPRKGTPLNQDRYQSLAAFCLDLCGVILHARINELSHPQAT
jgi:hypothetical protein